ncbi:hypothetical protein [Deinococcus sp. PESE-13]
MPQVEQQLRQPAPGTAAREGGVEIRVVVVAGVDEALPHGACRFDLGPELAPGVPAQLVAAPGEFAGDFPERQHVSGDGLRGDEDAHQMNSLTASAW